MKKYYLLVLFVLILSLMHTPLSANADYLAYESITMNEGQFLSEYSEADYKAYLKTHLVFLLSL